MENMEKTAGQDLPNVLQPFHSNEMPHIHTFVAYLTARPTSLSQNSNQTNT
jgi:hypothetical protein